MTLELCITTSAVFSEWNRYKLENAFGENKNANKSNLGGIPGLIAGSFDLSFFKKAHLRLRHLASAKFRHECWLQGRSVQRCNRPISWSFGVTVPVNRSRIHFSTEWFSDVKNYTILDDKDHVSQSTGDTIGFRLTDRLDDVLNFGIGSEIYLRDKLYFYASLCTDFSAIPENLTSFSSNQPTAANSTFTANLHHFAGGFVLNFPTVEPTMGATITGGRQQIARPVNFPDDGEDNIFDTTQTATLEWDRLRFVFSISVPFLDKKTREIIKKRNN